MYQASGPDRREPTVSRVQLALNVSNLDDAVAFYSKLFATAPAKVRPGYANFAIADPPLKLVLIEGHGEGLPTATEDEVACCYAVQDKVWVDGPDREPWEIYTVLADVEMEPGELRTVVPDVDSMCCA